MQPASAAKPLLECKCYMTNDFDFYAAVMTDCASEWKVTEDCPVHRKAAKPAEDGLEAQLRACIRYTAGRLRDEHEDLEEDIYAAVLNFIQAREAAFFRR
jgi:hypothetical protein